MDTKTSEMNALPNPFTTFSFPIVEDKKDKSRSIDSKMITKIRFLNPAYTKGSTDKVFNAVLIKVDDDFTNLDVISRDETPTYTYTYTNLKHLITSNSMLTGSIKNVINITGTGLNFRHELIDVIIYRNPNFRSGAEEDLSELVSSMDMLPQHSAKKAVTRPNKIKFEENDSDAGPAPPHTEASSSSSATDATVPSIEDDFEI